MARKPNPKKPLGDRIRELLGDRSVKWLADEIGITRSAASRIVNGHVDPAVSIVVAIAAALGVPVGELLD